MDDGDAVPVADGDEEHEVDSGDEEAADGDDEAAANGDDMDGEDESVDDEEDESDDIRGSWKAEDGEEAATSGLTSFSGTDKLLDCERGMGIGRVAGTVIHTASVDDIRAGAVCSEEDMYDHTGCTCRGSLDSCEGRPLIHSGSEWPRCGCGGGAVTGQLRLDCLVVGDDSGDREGKEDRRLLRLACRSKPDSDSSRGGGDSIAV